MKEGSTVSLEFQIPQSQGEVVTSALTSYLNKVEELGCLRAVMIGSTPKYPYGFVWNLFLEPVTEELTSSPTFTELSQAGDNLIRRTARALPIRIYDVNPQDLPKVEANCQKENFQIEVINF